MFIFKRDGKIREVKGIVNLRYFEFWRCDSRTWIVNYQNEGKVYKVSQGRCWNFGGVGWGNLMLKIRIGLVLKNLGEFWSLQIFKQS